MDESQLDSRREKIAQFVAVDKNRRALWRVQNYHEVETMSRKVKSWVDVVPAAWASRGFGALSELALPSTVQKLINRCFVSLAGIDMEESTDDIDAYETLNALFTRRLKKDARPLEAGLISPVDGRLSAFGQVCDGLVLEAKGQEFSLSELTGAGAKEEWLQSAYYFIIYLSPRNYHRIHTPITGAVTHMSYAPGRLLPVNRLGLWMAKDLFPTNERVTSFIEDEKGRRLALVKVGASCVGKISLAYDRMKTNASSERHGFYKELAEPYAVERGQELGVFNLGSTVILCVDSRNFEPESSLKLGQCIKLGQKLGDWMKK